MDDDADCSSDLAEAKATPQEKKEPLDSFAGSYLKEMDAFDEDLYGDLTIDLNQELTYVELKQLYADSQLRIKELTKENQMLKQQNLILKKNISSLYLTAREEIQRKDSQLSSYQDREMRKKVAYSRQQKPSGKSEISDSS